MRERIILVTALTILSAFCAAQAIDYSTLYRDMTKSRSFRFSYENDFFSASDRDYTQGVYIELINPNIKRFFVSRLLWHPINTNQQFGLAIETDGYTPNNIDRKEIQFNDRPYASTLLLKTFSSGKNASCGLKITNTLTMGVLGPLAGGKEIQESIHRWIGYTKPLGWHNQVKNEPVINYQLNVEKGLAGNRKNLLLTATGIARAGNLSTKAAAGLALMLGKFTNPYLVDEKSNKEFDVYVYEHATVNLVGYDATLQGGLLNNSSPYTIGNSQINRVVTQNRFGIVLRFRKVMAEYWQSFMTREFKTGIQPKTGGVQVSFSFS